MPTDTPSDVKFEIGHVLFIDIVGYSKLLMHEQTEQLQNLKEIVRSTEQFRLADAEGKLLRLPTGDDGALVFRSTLEGPVLCAIEIAKALKDHPRLAARIAIHSGPVNDISDLNEHANIAGAGINIAQRVMDCGDAGHILLSKHVAEDLGGKRARASAKATSWALFWPLIRRGDTLPARRRRKLSPDRPCLRRDVTCRKLRIRAAILLRNNSQP
jgi:class 3 adenylate cyclase